MAYLSPDSMIKAKANLGKLFSCYIPQVGYKHVLADGGAECLGVIGSGPAERSAGGESPGAPWPGVDVSGDALRAAIAITVTGRDLYTRETPVEIGTAPSFMMLMENRSISFMIDQTRLRSRAAGVTPLKIFAMSSQLFVTGRQKLNEYQEVNSDCDQLKSAGNQQCK